LCFILFLYILFFWIEKGRLISWKGEKEEEKKHGGV